MMVVESLPLTSLEKLSVDPVADTREEHLLQLTIVPHVHETKLVGIHSVSVHPVLSSTIKHVLVLCRVSVLLVLR